MIAECKSWPAFPRELTGLSEGVGRGGESLFSMFRQPPEGLFGAG